MKDNLNLPKESAAEGESFSAPITVSPAVIKRLPRYYRYLRELLQEDILRISSGALSEIMHVTASQIRQDLNCFGGFGQQGYGYNVKYLYGKISEILGVTENYTAVIIGTGNLGRALVGSAMFEHRGVDLVALFDAAPAVIGQEIGGYTVRDMRTLTEFVRAHSVDIAILTVPKTCAQTVAEQIAAAGIRGIWNFSSVELTVGGDLPVTVENVHMGDSLMTLMYELRKKDTDGV